MQTSPYGEPLTRVGDCSEGFGVPVLVRLPHLVGRAAHAHGYGTHPRVVLYQGFPESTEGEKEKADDGERPTALSTTPDGPWCWGFVCGCGTD